MPELYMFRAVQQTKHKLSKFLNNLAIQSKISYSHI